MGGVILGPDGQPVESQLKKAAEGLVEEWVKQESKGKWHIAKLRAWVKKVAEALDD